MSLKQLERPFASPIAELKMTEEMENQVTEA
jgi:hypothetical protein